ncbi:oligosaccharide flippase family protein [Sphingomonas silueang]|uniref:oligosaccharide flippase family protein n=1 Tax=Sphingomonas silueang TaxID=3156617 RepID=UPI0032B52E26
MIKESASYQKATTAAAVRWVALGNGVRTVFATMQLVVIASIVSVAEFGIIVLITTILQTIQQLSDGGLSTALIRFRNVTDHQKSSLFWANFGVGAILTIALSFGSKLVAEFFHAPTMIQALRVAAGTFILQAAYLQFRVLAERDLNFGRVVIAECAGAMVSFVVAIVLATWSYGIMSVVFGQVASCVVQLILAILLLGKNWTPLFRFRASDLRIFIGYSLDMFLAGIAIAITVQADMIFAGRYFSKIDLGSYAQPRDLCLKIMLAVLPIITRVGLPLMAKSQSSPISVGKIYLKIVRLTSTVAFSIYLPLGIVASYLMPLILGSQWSGAASLFTPIAIWFSFRSTINPFGTYLTSLGESRLALIYQSAFAALILGVSFVLVHYGPFALSLGMIGVYIAFSQVCWLVLWKRSGITFFAYQSNVIRPALGAIPASSVLWILLYFISPTIIDLITTLKVGLVLAVGAVALLIGNIFINKEGISHAFSMLPSQLRKWVS